MKKRLIGIACMTVVLMVGASTISASEIENKFTVDQFLKAKAFYDDPRPYLKNLDLKNLMAPEEYRNLICDQELSKKVWAETIGFKAPDVVGKIAPEIKPGVYSYKNKEQHPGLKELMIPFFYEQFAAGGPPFIGKYPEIKVIPTRQYYYHQRLAEATKKNEGKTKLDAQGYILSDTYISGWPFPKPSGAFKAQQIMYNQTKRPSGFENLWVYNDARGFAKNLQQDSRMLSKGASIQLEGRVIGEPYGWFDERARKQQEANSLIAIMVAPQQMFGNATTMITYSPVEKLNLNLTYVAPLRRIKKMSSTDTQDAVGGQDMIFDDAAGFSQKLTPKLYPYKYEFIAEREYLMPSYTLDGSAYVTSKE